MGSLFQHGRVRLNLGGPKYQRLDASDPWVGLDDDEDDDELINPNSATTTNHPAYRDNKSGHFEELTIDVDDNDEGFLYDRRMLERQGSPSYRTFVSKQEAACRGNRRPIFCTVAAVVICIIVVCLIYLLLPCGSSEPVPSSTNSNSTTNNTILERSRDFAINVTGATETSIRLFDTNNDGVDDIIFGYSRVMDKLNEDGMRSFCESINMPVPCAGAVTALDGRDGTLLWELNVECEVFAIQCGKLDVNEDGQKDCIIAGRLGLLHAVDTTNGAKLWSADPAMTNTSWNYYQPQIIPDLDGDGVPDLVVSHGGNGDYKARQTNRDANRLMLLSGKTGKSLGRNYLETPDREETYSAVTLYEKKSGAIYVLFGTGGETVKGSFWVISLLDLYCHVMDYGHGSECKLGAEAKSIPTLQSTNYGDWGTPLTVTEEGVREIIRCDINKGVMVPTVLADMNKDGTLDLIVSIFNGTVALLDGRDLSIIWTTGDKFEGFETYSTPAPGYFNSDDIPDLMVRLSHGNWSAHYNSTLVFILDGRNGEMLWSTRSHSKEPVMASPLSVRGDDHKDAFVFWIQGRNNNAASIDLSMHHPPPPYPVTPQPRDGKNDRRLTRHDDKGLPIDCDEITKQFECELLIMNRDLTRNPLRVALSEPYKLYDNSDSIFSPAEDSPLRRKRHHDSPSNPSQGADESPQNIPPFTTKTPTPPLQKVASTQQLTPKAAGETPQNMPLFTTKTPTPPLQKVASSEQLTPKAGETPQNIPLFTTKTPTPPLQKATSSRGSTANQQTSTRQPATKSSQSQLTITMATEPPAGIITELPKRTFAADDFATDKDSPETPKVVTQRTFAPDDFTTNLITSPAPQEVPPTVMEFRPFDGYPVDDLVSASPTDFSGKVEATPPKVQSPSPFGQDFVPYHGDPIDDDEEEDNNGAPNFASPYDREMNPFHYSNSPANNNDDDYDAGDDIFGHNQGHQFTYEGASPPDDFHEPLGGEHHHHDENDIPCVMVSSWLRVTGTIGDVDKDGILDIVYIINFLSPSSMKEGHVGINSAYSTVVKKSLQGDLTQDFITLDPEKTYCSGSIGCKPWDGNNGYELKADLEESKWMGYCGTDGDCKFE